MRIDRRSVLRGSFWGALGLGALGGGVAMVRFLYPVGLENEGSVLVHAADVPEPGGEPYTHKPSGFHLVHLQADDVSDPNDDGFGAGGLLALSWKCTHLGCAAPWNADGAYPDGSERVGIFDCPCHGSKFSVAGVLLNGPAPRSLDVLRVEVTASGNVIVRTHDKAPGTIDNARRAVPWTRPS